MTECVKCYDDTNWSNIEPRNGVCGRCQRQEQREMDAEKRGYEDGKVDGKVDGLRAAASVCEDWAKDHKANADIFRQKGLVSACVTAHCSYNVLSECGKRILVLIPNPSKD